MACCICKTNFVSQPVLIIGNAGNCRQSAQGQGNLDINPGVFYSRTPCSSLKLISGTKECEDKTTHGNRIRQRTVHNQTQIKSFYSHDSFIWAIANNISKITSITFSSTVYNTDLEQFWISSSKLEKRLFVEELTPEKHGITQLVSSGSQDVINPCSIFWYPCVHSRAVSAKMRSNWLTAAVSLKLFEPKTFSHSLFPNWSGLQGCTDHLCPKHTYIFISGMPKSFHATFFSI